MKYKEFLELLSAYRKFQEDTSELYDLGFDFMEGKFKLSEYIEEIIQTSIKSHYGEQGWDWVSWFIYESDWGEKDWGKYPTYKMNEDGTSTIYEDGELRFGAQDENGNPICYSLESLYEYLEKECKK